MKVCSGLEKRRVWLDKNGRRDEEGFSVSVGKSNEEDQHSCDNFVLHSKTCILFLSSCFLLRCYV